MSWTKKNQVQIRHRRRNMEENPFSALINMQRNDVNQRQRSVFQTFCISTLLNHSPFTVKIGGIPCSGTELLINQTLLNEETKPNIGEQLITVSNQDDSMHLVLCKVVNG